MRTSLRTKMLAWFGLVLVPIVAILTYLAFTTYSVGRGFSEARAVDDLDQAVRQVLLWTTDYSLTWKPDSQRSAETWAKRYRETSGRLRERSTRAETAAALDELDRGFEGYWKLAMEMADAYIRFDRVVGNSYTDNFHTRAKGLEDAVQKLKDEVTLRMQGDLGRGTRLAVASAVLIVVILVVGALAIAAALVRPIRALLLTLQDIAEGAGDLTKRLNVTSGDELGELAGCFNRVMGKLHDIISQVRGTAAHVVAASHQVMAATDQLAAGAQAQASSLEETAASLEQITGTVKQNADNARQASELAVGSRDIAQTGGQVVTSAVAAMSELNRSAQKIADIITVIDDIAFQTNLLALNAAVEAARAGEHGRGFAVVAAEVRNLAQRSAAAAKEIKALIQDSVEKVEGGSALVTRSGLTLQEIVASVKRVTEIVTGIAAASQEQSQGIDQVNRAVGQMDEVVQSNVAQTTQLSSTAQALAAEAAELHALVGRFRLDDGVAGGELSAGDPPSGVRRRVARASSTGVGPVLVGVGGGREARRRADDGDEF